MQRHLPLWQPRQPRHDRVPARPTRALPPRDAAALAPSRPWLGGRQSLATTAPRFSRGERLALPLRLLARGSGAPGARAPRPGGRALLLAALLLLSFVLTCAVPILPLLWLAHDASDALTRVRALQALLAHPQAALASPAALASLQRQVDALQHDLFVLDGAASVLAAPAELVDPRVRDLVVLTYIGTDLATAANDGLTIATTLLTPLERSAVASAGGGTSLSMGDIRQAQSLLADATARLRDAIASESQLIPGALPAQASPGSPLGKLLARLPTALALLQRAAPVLAAAPALLGIGTPAYYLVVAMDSTELRPAGGLMGNYGLLVLQNGHQSATHPLALHDTYALDHAYYVNPALNSDPNPLDTPACMSSGPQPPARYWWWPIRDFSCQYGWGLRDSGLSPNFPSDARAAIAIAEQAGVAPAGAIQGMIAFTPALIEHVLAITGPVTVPQFNIRVDASNVVHEIHQYELAGKTPAGLGTKTFTHDLSIALLGRVRTLRGAALAGLVKAALTSLQTKDLELYFADPRAEAPLAQAGLAATLDSGTGNGFMVVDTNDGGNKANLFVTEQQTDVVELLPGGGALHITQIAVTYDKRGLVYEGTTHFEDYSDVQRTYLPGSAELLGYSGFDPPIFYPAGCGAGGYASPISACDPLNALTTPVVSASANHVVLLGALLIPCGPDGALADYNPAVDYAGCLNAPTPHTRDVYVVWYTPQAYHLNAQGNGSYRETIQKQSGSRDALAVYVSTALLTGPAPNLLAIAAPFTGQATTAGERAAAFQALLAGAHGVYAAPLTQDTTATYSVHGG